MGARGPTPALVSNDVLCAWWSAGDWVQLAPVLQRLAYVVALRIVHDTDEANDIAQNALVRCWRVAIVPDAPSAFVGRVARNLALDVFKRGSVRHEVRMEDVEAEAPARGPLDAMVLAEALARLRMALRFVPEVLRRPLVLHAFHRRTAQELAEQFGTTEGAMKMRLVRARAALRAIYEDAPRPARWPPARRLTGRTGGS